MRDKWVFNVGGGLTIMNIYFDGIDSVIQPYDDLKYKFNYLALNGTNICRATTTSINGLLAVCYNSKPL